ncbi:Caffeoylshikimate esterase [Striga hermonthica]|uniref:Caffeoylshikimate esterase n=1 Tax=Striga hermonthica TaxID=68872 RepID=A0A9N7RK24_STRHE|nr:Caffeoylshikimate esterase [Striga hermonthica]
MFQKIYLRYAGWGSSIFGADLLGHGRHVGLCRGFEQGGAGSPRQLFKSIGVSNVYNDLLAFLSRKSMGGVVTQLMHFLSEEDLGTDLFFTAPLFVILVPMKPSMLILVR